MPVGARVDSVVRVPAPRTVWYRRSWNSMRWRLNPVVLALAMLLATPSSWVSWAAMPVAAICNERNTLSRLRSLALQLGYQLAALLEKRAQRSDLARDISLQPASTSAS